MSFHKYFIRGGFKHNMKISGIVSSFVLIVFVAGCGGTSDKSLRQIPRSQRKGLAVMNYVNNTPKSRAEEYQPWEFGIASMIMTDVETIGAFNIVSNERMKDVLAQQSFQLTGMVDEKTAVELGKIVGASYILAGSFTEMKGQLRMETQVFSVEKGTQLGTAAVMGKTDNFFDLEKDLFTKISGILNVMLTEEEQGKINAKIETKSVEASLNNYRGEVAVIKAKDLAKEGKKDEAKKIIEEAKKDFNKAIELDPNYTKAKQNLSKISLAIPVTL